MARRADIPAEPASRHLRYIDSARGYAVLLVFTCHLAAKFPELPYPVHRVVANGWFGVQLFFIASCLTLLLSWHGETRRFGRNDVTGFFIRRFFRIAPAYYAAGIFYFFFLPPAGGFDATLAATTALFVTAWHPSWVPMDEAAWTVVPGSWTISVEFTFYALFPLYVAWLTTLRRAVAILLLSLVAGAMANIAAARLFAGWLSPRQILGFLYFWFPNQMGVFAVGGVLSFLINRLNRPGSALGAWARRLAPFGATLAIAGFIGLGFLPVSQYIGESLAPPGPLAVSLVFALFLLALSREPALFSNRYIATMGKVSFSAYLIHWAVLDLSDHAAGPLQFAATGWTAIGAYALSWVLLVPVVFVLSWLSFRLIEQPMIAAGAAINARRRARRTAAVAGL